MLRVNTFRLVFLQEVKGHYSKYTNMFALRDDALESNVNPKQFEVKQCGRCPQ